MPRDVTEKNLKSNNNLPLPAVYWQGQGKLLNPLSLMCDLESDKKEKPKLIYKYARINEDTQNSLKESYLWLASAKTLNDPFDLAFQITDRFCEQLKVENTYFKDFKNKELQKIVKDNIGLTACSFTILYDDILMWSHYANKHNGVCLIYSLENTPALYQMLLPVRYSNEYPIIDSFGDEESDKKMVLTKSRLRVFSVNMS